MKITIIGSGSSGNSTLIEFKNKKILIDVGFSYKYIKERLEEIGVNTKEINYIFITHEHNDHIKGLKSFLNNNNPILCISKKISKQFDYINQYQNKIFLEEDIIDSEFKIILIPTSHDSIDSNAFVVEDQEESLVYITDTGYINERNFNYLKNRNYYIIESNHDEEMLLNGPYPDYLQRRILSDKGHLSNRSSANYIVKLIGKNTKKIILAHLSEKNNTEELALKTYKEILNSHNKEFKNIKCAKQDQMVKL